MTYNQSYLLRTLIILFLYLIFLFINKTLIFFFFSEKFCLHIFLHQLHILHLKVNKSYLIHQIQYLKIEFEFHRDKLKTILKVNCNRFFYNGLLLLEVFSYYFLECITLFFYFLIVLFISVLNLTHGTYGHQIFSN